MTWSGNIFAMQDVALTYQGNDVYFSSVFPLGAEWMVKARHMDFTPVPSSWASPYSTSDNMTRYSNILEPASYGLFAFDLKKGATYSFTSRSFFEPLSVLYAPDGEVVAVGGGDRFYGEDTLGFVPAYSGTFYLSAGWQQGSASGHTGVSLTAFEDLDTISKAVTHYGTNRVDVAKITGSRSDYDITIDGQSVVILHKLGMRGDAEQYENIERFRFNDAWVAADVAGNAGKAYRLYEAAFDRKPDASGLGFWIKALDSGASLQSVAQGFVGSKEFKGLYGEQISQAEFVSAVYTNVLGRAPDQAGADFWVTALNNGASRAQVLMGFSESPENQAGVIGAIQNGIQYEFFA